MGARKLCFLAILGWSSISSDVTAATSPEEPAWTLHASLMSTADEAVMGGRLADAMTAYRDAYDVLPREVRAGDYGRRLIGQVVAIVLEADGGGSSDPAVIDAVVALIDLHRADVEIEGHGPSAQILESERAALVARRDALDVRADAANATDESRPPARSREPDATESDPDEPRATLVPSERLPPARKDPREVLGPTLIAVGSAGTLAGVGLLLGGGLEARSDLAYYEDNVGACPAAGPCRDDYSAYRNDVRRTRTAFVVSGALLGGMGIAALIVGAIRTKKVNARTSVSSLRMKLGPGAVLGGRF